MNKKIKILTIFASPWQESNNVGNTFTNILGGDFYEIAHIYCSPDYPNTVTATKFYRITESQILNSIINKHILPGNEVTVHNKDAEIKKSISTRLKPFRWQIIFWIRELIWQTQKWKTKELEVFVKSFNPDLIFYNISYFSYLNNIAIHIKKKTEVPMVGYVWDDIYSLKQFSLSPLYWINRFISRSNIRKVVKECDLLYAILESQQKEYSNYFNRPFKILFKGADFSNSHIKNNINHPLKIVYTGNIFSGRWKTLAKIATILKDINTKGIKIQLYISTPHHVSPRMLSKLEIKDSSFFVGKLPIEKVKDFQKSADILLYVEPFNVFERYIWRLSFSTKLVDYFKTARCILAIGWKGSGGIEYLKKTNSALIITKPNEIKHTLAKLVSDNSLISKYSLQSLNTGKNNHNLKAIRLKLHNDLLTLLNQFPSEND